MTSTETKLAVVKTIKELGFNSRQVSVSIKRGSLEAMLIVTVRDNSIEKETIEDAVQKFEKVYRCERSGEILGGGNCFIYVRKEKLAA